MTLMMGMDQHRAQISTEWIDTITGEISRARVAPADRAGVRKFLTRFNGQGLEVALDATTGWRFVVEELDRVGADVHLAEVVQTSGMKGRGKRPKTDWADARHLRELLLIGRLPESWIPPAPLLDLRARVRCRHTLLHQRTEWQQRMQAVLYHHGVPQARGLLKLEQRDRIAALALPAAAHEQLRDRLAADRRDRCATRPVRPLAPRLRPQTDRVPDADQGDLGRRSADGGHDPRRARRHPPV
jgi:transposase